MTSGFKQCSLTLNQVHLWVQSSKKPLDFYLVLNAASHFNTFPRVSAISLHKKRYLRIIIRSLII